nr:putative late blight resistance protein homolog R1A-3 [Coffea arabica]
MDISSGSSTSCFDSALDYLGWLDKAFQYKFHSDLKIWDLKIGLTLLQSFDLYLRNSRRRRNHETCSEQDVEEKDVTSFRIQSLIIRRMQDLEFACSKLFIHASLPGILKMKGELTLFRKEIKLFFKTDINESCINFLLDYYWLRDPGLVIDFIDLVSKILIELLLKSQISHFKTLEEKLMFLNSFIRFVLLHGVEGQHLIDLLVHAEVVAINALRLICTRWFDRDDEEECDEMRLQISRLLREKINPTPRDGEEVYNKIGLQISQLIREKINPSDPQVRETCIHVLTASKLSRSSDTSALEKNKHLVADFMDYLIHNFMELLESCTSILVPIMNQMLELHDGLRFLTILFRHQEKFTELPHGMKTLTGVVVCDAAIVIFSLSVSQIEEGLAKETDLALFHLLQVLKFIKAEVMDPITSISGFDFPRTNELGSMDILLENLKELQSCNEADDSIAFPYDQIHRVLEDLVFLRSFLGKIVDQCNQNKKLQAFWRRVMEVAYKAELVIDSTPFGDEREYCFDVVARDINLMKIEAQEIYGSMSDVGETKRVTKTFTPMPSRVTAATYNEDLVLLDNEVTTITHRLTGGSRQLDVVPIVGVPGLGKTTLANIVYSSPSVMLHFQIRAWCTVSQVYSRHNLLVQILGSIDSRSPEQYLKVDEDDLAVKLKQVLLRNRYLLVLDDLWDIEAWNLLERSLPDDANGSRILVMSRLLNLQFKPGSKAHYLRHLTDEESWQLLQKKLFGNEGCPTKLHGVGSQIVKYCRGLPLTVVLAAGIFATTAQNFWEEVAKSLSFSIALDKEYCMKTLELSYIHLPDDLKPCLLYFGVFQEDENVPVRRLLWLWISEGFVRKKTGKRIVDVADDYLKALVDRSLVMVTKQRTTSGAKACRLHDLVHEFCVEKAKEENFLHIICRGKDPFNLTGLSNPHRVCDQNTRKLKIQHSMLFFPNLRSLLSFKEEELGFWLPKLLRVLDLRNLVFDAYFPMEVVLLVHLRYLALHIRGINSISNPINSISIPFAISNLSRLQTFLVRGDSIFYYVLPKTIWNIKTLRHLCITGFNYGFVFPVDDLEISPCLDHLNTLKLAIDPSSQSLQKLLTYLPSIRRLKCKRSEKSSEEFTRIDDKILVFDCLSQLESLNLSFFYGYGFKFPLNLKKLTLSYNDQPWSEISTIGKLPNLQVLNGSFVGIEEWEMKEGEFPNLRVLNLIGLALRSWTASSDSFLLLEKLVVHNCPRLKEVPSCLGECPTLEMIEVKWCDESVVRSMRQIQQEQMDMGNDVLEIIMEYCGHA